MADEVSTYESWLNQQGKHWESDKSFTDKILGRQDTDRLISLIQKDELSRQDFSEVLNIVSGINSKLVNYNEFDRFLLGKFYTWIRSFIKIAMGIIHVQEMISTEKTRLEQTIGIGTDDKNKTKVEVDDKVKKEIERDIDIYTTAVDVLAKSRNINCDDSKYLLDVFLLLSNSTLSIGAAAFDTLTTARFEYAYPSGMPTQMPTSSYEQSQKRQLMPFMRSKNLK